MEAFTMLTEEHEQNRSSWNLATEQHHRHQPQLVSDYIDKARNKLFAEDMKLLGDLQGKDVLHLQCNDGQDTVSIARWLKPRQVHGVDISDFAVNFAKELSTKMLEQNCFDAMTEVRFTRRDVVEYLNDPVHSKSVDVVYSSYGTVNWLSNLKTWAMGIANVLRPGGRFVIIDFHAVAMALDWQSMQLKYGCLGGTACPSDDGVSDYVGQDAAFQNPNPSMEYAWGVGDIVTSLLETRQMQLQSLTEYPYVNGYQMHETLSCCNVPMTSEAPEGQLDGQADSATLAAGYGGLPQDVRYAPPPGSPVTPMMYSIVATKHDKKRFLEDCALAALQCCQTRCFADALQDSLSDVNGQEAFEYCGKLTTTLEELVFAVSPGCTVAAPREFCG